MGILDMFVGVASGGMIRHHINPVKEFKSTVKAFKEVDKLANPLTGTLSNQVLGKRLREIEGKAINELTGTRRKNHHRLDDQKQQAMNEAMNRIRELFARDEDIMEIVQAEAAALRSLLATSSAGVDRGLDFNVPNPIFVYESCISGTTEELANILNLDPTHEDYMSFISLNPLKAAYLAYVASNISINALRMLSEHTNESLSASKTTLQESLWLDISNAIGEVNFNKVKRVISVFIQFNNQEIFINEVQNKLSIYQSLINNGILQSNVGVVVFSETCQNYLDTIHPINTLAPELSSRPRCRI